MSLWNKKELLESLKSQIIKYNFASIEEIDNISKVTIDSRKSDKNSLFIALKGENQDGNSFLPQIVHNGCTIAIISDEAIYKNYQNNEIKLILVKDGFASLNLLAQYSRNRSQALIIAITGSVGKTTSKEMLKLALSQYKKTFANEGNLNNHIGMPLSLVNLDISYEVAIFEMGMNHSGEISALSEIAKPHIAIITNIGTAHLEFFKSQQEIALAKAEIFNHLTNFKGQIPQIILNGDSEFYKFLKEIAIKKHAQNVKISSYGISNNNDYNIITIDDEKFNEVKIVATTNKNNLNQSCEYQLNTNNQAIIYNSLIALAVIDNIGLEPKIGLVKLLEFKLTAGRGLLSEILVDNKNITIIDDSYNSSLTSIDAGLKNASKIKKSLHKKRLVAIIGDMLELGEKSTELHLQAMGLISQHSVDLAILVGKETNNASQYLKNIKYFNFHNSIDASQSILQYIENDDIIYIKGSRGIKLELIVNKLKSATS
ncbi:MAG: UDP-N-acetylmuramoyl-tripeptide--D-alanyl-D-alanine ligase [Rickettsiales bacterium]|nr:UDP-N-acetylmuramoyl-tripeptide--D-alanyl-D-alanine ligase [Rickettsiales bacterium]